jgi:hypothetical protein
MPSAAVATSWRDAKKPSASWPSPGSRSDASRKRLGCLLAASISFSMSCATPETASAQTPEAWPMLAGCLRVKIVADTPAAVTVATMAGYLTLGTMTVPRANVFFGLGALRLCRDRDGVTRLYVPDPRPPEFDIERLSDGERARIAGAR